MTQGSNEAKTNRGAERPLAETQKRVDQWIAALLRSGVILSATLVLIGGALYLARHAGPVPNYHVFQGEPAELRSIAGIFHAALGFSGRGLIQLGLVLLIATPVARVAFSVIVFLYERDWTYVVVTLIVLGLLCYSVFAGHG